MSTNFVDAKGPSKKDKEQTSLVKYKLRIYLVFQLLPSSQKDKARAFRKKEKGEEYFKGNDLAQELSGGQICYTDEDEGGEYIIDDKTFVVNESSPKAMMNLSREIDNYVKGFCIKDDVEKIVPCFFVPSVSIFSVVPRLFFYSFPPLCIQKASPKGLFDKIDNQKGYVYFFGFDSIQSYTNSVLISSSIGNNTSISKTLIQILILVSYYVYFYIDYYEQKNWTFFKNDIKKQKYIDDFLNKKAQKEIKTGKPSVWEKIGHNIATNLMAPFKIITWAADALLNYDGHVTNRIFTRIADVVMITSSKDNVKFNTSKAINNILSASEKYKPVGLYSFFEMCGYWDYLGPEFNSLKSYCKEWKVSSSSAGFLSGYGAVLFSNGEDYIYGFKGTDFDSYGRDWVLTNLLQGLTGFSAQHYRAVVEGSKLDKSISNGGNLWFTGHSLGGGLASAATIATKHREGVTFNAAGLNVIGVKTIQLFKNTGGIFHPNQSWNRVYPYRIKGEVLDNFQKTTRYVGITLAKYSLPLITIAFLERGYGKKSVDYDIKVDGENVPCLNRHGINNFLYKEVMEKIAPYEEVEADDSESSYNKIKNIMIKGKESKSFGNL